jgi:hypothetical protein
LLNFVEPRSTREKTMKRSALRFTGVVVATLGVIFPPLPVEAGPSTSPSARQAARLKHNPPRGWIRHYLPDDRYKILGGTWKYVSTELDRFYYPAWAPEMLSRPAGRVIGFASAQDAEEAGYMPGSGYAGIGPGFDRNLAISQSTTTTSTTTSSTSGASRRIRLADGVSSVVVPAGWAHTRTTQSIPNMGNMRADSLTPVTRGRNSRQAVVIIATTVPGLPANVDLGRLLQADVLQNQTQRIGSWGGINNQASNAQNVMRSISFRPATLGGLRGIVATPLNPTARRELGFEGPTLIAGRGSKLYIVASSLPRNTAGYSAILRSLQLR